VIFGERPRIEGESYCPPSLTLLHVGNGTSPYMLYHSCTADFEFFFFDTNGQPLDTMHRANAISPSATELPNGIFVTYESQALFGQQVLLWMDFAGSVTREDTVTVNPSSIVKVYAEATRAVLIEYYPHQDGQLVAIDAVLHAFEADGLALPPDTIYSETLPAGFTSSGIATFDYTEGRLRMLVPTVQLSPLSYRVRLVEHIPGNTIVHDDFDPGPLPQNNYASNWAVAPGPWGMSIIGFRVASESGTQAVWLEGLDVSGQSTSLVHIEPMVENEAVNDVDMLAIGGSIYASFTTAPLPGGEPGGAFLFAFPQEEILAADDNFIPHPSSFGLSSYPNPFNAQATISFALSHSGEVKLNVYDVTGRLVRTLLEAPMASGPHQVTFNAGDLPSGIYLARLTAGDATFTRKLVLLK
jgi:hypothetical protein